MEAGGGGPVAIGPDATVLSLPEGASMMIGDDGEQYVTISQDGQTYAIPLAEYQAMQPGGTITIQAQQLNPEELMNNPPQIVVTATTPGDQSMLNQGTPEAVQISSPSLTKAPSSSNVKWASPSVGSSTLKPWTGAALEPRKYKPIKVDNWGIFLLSRLQTYFQKKEYTDLTLRFPEKNAQIKVHKLVVNACTDYFIKQEEAGLIQDGLFDMPSNFLPELVAPIIRFMYTGRLDMKSNILFTRLRDTAVSLGMLVLAKLLDAQINAPPAVFQQTSNKKKKMESSDPVKQIKRIKKIEKKFERDSKQRNSMTRNQVDSDKIIPGKKLPIWKKRETTVNSQLNELNIKQEVQASPKAYGKSSTTPEPSNSGPRQLREIQENANFEKVRQSSTTAKENIAAEIITADTSDHDNPDESHDLDEDDYYDNDAGLDYDEAVDEDEAENNEQITSDLDFTPKITTPPVQKPILKSAEKDAPLPRKSVRFSLRPGSKVQTESKSTEIITPDTHQDDLNEDDNIAAEPSEIKSPPKKRRSGGEDAMDKTVEEFSRAIEQEEKELETPPKTTRRGRVIHPPNLESPSETPTPKRTPRRASSGGTPPTDHTPIIAELMRKNPEMFKGNKPVKIKVMTKDSKGKNVVKVITVKAQPAADKSIDLTPKSVKSPPPSTSKSSETFDSPASTSPKVNIVDANGSISLRATPKVKYTGKRGRPPIIKVGETDPHAKERVALENNFKVYNKAQIAEAAGEAESFANFEEVTDKMVPVSTEELNTSTGSNSQLDPSSEAESLSHVASGIAASLGLTSSADSPSSSSVTLTDSQSGSTGPLSDLVHFEESEESFPKETRGLKRTRSETSMTSTPPKKVSKLAMEWTEDEEAS